jgi:plasmid stabilization system protein ParE
VGPSSARKITNKIFDAIARLTIFPAACPLVRDEKLKSDGYRMLVCGKYLCFYRLVEHTIVVYHIAHGATDYPKLFE